MTMDAVQPDVREKRPGFEYQRRTVLVLSGAQVVGGIGNGAGLAVGALIVREVTGSAAWAGMAIAMITLGAAVFTVPLAKFAAARGRRPALTGGWLVGALGAAVTVVGTEWASLWVCLVGLTLFGAATAANLQSRFAAVDLAETTQVGRALSIVVWSTTLGAVLGPNLTGPGADLAKAVSIPALAGPIVFSLLSFATAAVVTHVGLRPDPLLVARERSTSSGQWPVEETSGIRSHLRGATLTGVFTVCSAHAVMVGIMAMTPVHMQDHGASFGFIGFTISMHIAGMYALSPVMGWLNDRWGSVRTIVVGQLLLVIAAITAGTSGGSGTHITVGLVLLGLGWSASYVAGSALLSRDAPVSARPAVQGFSDLVMNLSGAGGGLIAGLVVAGWGFGTVNGVAALLTVPVLVAMRLARRLPHKSTSDVPCSDPYLGTAD